MTQKISQSVPSSQKRPAVSRERERFCRFSAYPASGFLKQEARNWPKSAVRFYASERPCSRKGNSTLARRSEAECSLSTQLEQTTSTHHINGYLNPNTVSAGIATGKQKPVEEERVKDLNSHPTNGPRTGGEDEGDCPPNPHISLRKPYKTLTAPYLRTAAGQVVMVSEDSCEWHTLLAPATLPMRQPHRGGGGGGGGGGDGGGYQKKSGPSPAPGLT